MPASWRNFFDNVIGLEKIVAARTKALERVTAEREQSEALIAATRIRDARSEGMAEVATGVLHNIGNALNSVNVSAAMASDRLRTTGLPRLSRAVTLLEQNAATGSFLTDHAQGRQLPGYLRKLTTHLEQEHAELESLRSGVGHLIVIVGAQQAFARVGNTSTGTERITPRAVFEEAMALALASRGQDGFEVVTDFPELPALQLDRHRLIEILVNLITNAAHALREGPPGPRRLHLSLQSSDARLRFVVQDSGAGIDPSNLVKIFSHGFTTRAAGHGFGLHASACAAIEMGGLVGCESPGVGLGSTFHVEIPLDLTAAAPRFQEAA